VQVLLLPSPSPFYTQLPTEKQSGSRKEFSHYQLPVTYLADFVKLSDSVGWH
jgi:hypothetical protein